MESTDESGEGEVGAAKHFPSYFLLSTGTCGSCITNVYFDVSKVESFQALSTLEWEPIVSFPGFTCMTLNNPYLISNRCGAWSCY